MRNRGSIGVGVLGVVLFGAVAAADDLGRYREFALGSSVAAVSTLTGVAGSELRARYRVHRSGGVRFLSQATQ